MTSPYELWKQAGGDTPNYSRDRYLGLLRKHGLLRDLEPGEKAEPLPCGWPNRRHTADLIEASSLGTPEAKRRRRSVNPRGDLTGMPEEQADWEVDRG